jgi:regulator of nonsense transcripts 2
MPILPTSSSTGNSIQIGTNTGALFSDEAEEAAFAALGGKWEDEEERRFFEDIQDLSEIVPKSILGVEESKGIVKGVDESEAEAKKNAEDEEVKRLEEELAGLEAPSPPLPVNGKVDSLEAEEEEDDGYATFLVGFVISDDTYLSYDSAATPTPSTPKEGSRPNTPALTPQGPSQLLTALLARLPDCTNRTLIDQAAVDFAFLNSKAARKRLVKVSAGPRLPIECMLTPHSVVPHSGSENEDRLASALFSARGYSKQVHARCGHRAYCCRRSPLRACALCS